jgi:hypothetical protein
LDHTAAENPASSGSLLKPLAVQSGTEFEEILGNLEDCGGTE